MTQKLTFTFFKIRILEHSHSLKLCFLQLFVGKKILVMRTKEQNFEPSICAACGLKTEAWDLLLPQRGYYEQRQRIFKKKDIHVVYYKGNTNETFFFKC